MSASAPVIYQYIIVISVANSSYLILSKLFNSRLPIGEVRLDNS